MRARCHSNAADIIEWAVRIERALDRIEAAVELETESLREKAESEKRWACEYFDKAQKLEAENERLRLRTGDAGRRADAPPFDAPRTAEAVRTVLLNGCQQMKNALEWNCPTPEYVDRLFDWIAGAIVALASSAPAPAEGADHA
jgi:hypothetical protein